MAKTIYRAHDILSDTIAESEDFKAIYRFAKYMVAEAILDGKKTVVKIGVIRGQYKLLDKYWMYDYEWTYGTEYLGHTIELEDRTTYKTVTVRKIGAKEVAR